MYLAVDVQAPMALPEYIAAWIAAAPDGAQLVALVDLAFDHEHGKPLNWPHERVPLYADDALTTVSPTLLAMRPQAPHAAADPEALAQGVRRLLRHCQGRPMLSLLQTRLSLPELAKAWQGVRWVKTADGQRFLLRMADTRVLVTLPSCLAPAQWARVCRPVLAWHVVNRLGDWQALPIPPSPMLAEPDTIQVGSEAPFEIDDDELGRLLDAAQPDALIHALHRDVPDVLPQATDRAKVHAWVSAACELARQHGLDGSTDQLTLAAVVCATAGEALSHPALPELLASHRPGQADLADALATLLPEYPAASA